MLLHGKEFHQAIINYHKFQMELITKKLEKWQDDAEPEEEKGEKTSTTQSQEEASDSK